LYFLLFPKNFSCITAVAIIGAAAASCAGAGAGRGDGGGGSGDRRPGAGHHQERVLGLHRPHYCSQVSSQGRLTRHRLADGHINHA
jgi:hypothetical protein